MSYNLVDPTTGDLTRVAGGIDTSIIPSNASASNKLATSDDMTHLLKNKMSCYTWDTNKTLRAVFYEVTDRDIMPDVNDTVGKRVIARYGNVLINRITQLNGIKNFYWDNTLVLSCPFNDDITKLTDVLEIFVGTTSWVDIIASANKIVPNYTSVVLSSVTTPNTIKYIKLADCAWAQTGTLQVYLFGAAFEDTLVINFSGGNALYPSLCGHYSGNGRRVLSVIAQKGSDYSSDYSIYIKVQQLNNLTVNIALLKGDCTINITESTTAPTNITEWATNYGLFGNITAPNITSLEQRVTALESKL